MTDLKQKLEAKLEVCKKAAPGPWFDDGYRGHGPTNDEDKRNGPVLYEYKHFDAGHPNNGSFIAAARDGSADYEQVLSCCLMMLDALEKIEDAINDIPQDCDRTETLKLIHNLSAKVTERMR